MKKRLISLILSFALLLSVFAVTASAAKEEEFISEVALIYEDSVEDAKEKIKGTEWKLFEQDLNPNADYILDDGVYLVYKTSTNVEDAITDLRVMDMYGGYSISNYERQLEKSRSEYMKLVADLRIAAAELKAADARGDRIARLALAQMSLYQDKKTEGGTETDMTMDDFFRNMPSDEQVVQLLMEGNSFIVSGLIALLAVGISGEGEASLAAQVAEKYAIKDTLKDEKYASDAASLYTALEPIRAKLLRYDALREQYVLDDEEMTDEEFTFWTSIAPLAANLEQIKFQDKFTDTTLAAILRKGEYTAKDLYPIVAALTEGQMALIRMGQLETVLNYGAPAKPYEELRAYLDEYTAILAEDYGVSFFNKLDVYTGVDRSIFKGSFAMTNAAERQQALTGETWDLNSAVEDSKLAFILTGIVGGLGAVSLLGNLGIGASILAAKVAYAVGSHFGYSMASTYAWSVTAPIMYGETIIFFSAISAGVILIAAGISGIALWYNYYNPDYTEIPNTMVDVRETDLGDKYIKYTAAKVYGDEEKNADFNAYEGKEWIALYYTKDAAAGKCLIPTFVHKDNDSTVARRHQGISMFGESEAFNLNEHVYNDDAPGVYVTVRYSTTKKAIANLPTATGSIFATGALYALTALGGAGLGVGGTVVVQRAKKKKESSVTDSE